MSLTLDEEHRSEVATADAFTALVNRLSRQSVEKHFDAYADVAWDSPEFAIDPADPRFELWAGEPLGATAWYRNQSPEVRARIGLHRWGTAMRTGWEFENLLQRGLLRFVFHLDNGRSEFRYLHHEIVEESHHSMMFQEFVNRTGLPVRGMPRILKLLAETFVVPLATLHPTLFFTFVLGGEDPIDHIQRQRLREGGTHPLVDRITKIHVTEEARHLSFARHYLKAEVPRLSWVQRQLVAVPAPVLLGIMARLMIHPTRSFGRANAVPRAVLLESRRNEAGRALRRDSLAKVRRLFGELGLINPVSRTLWKAFGIWDEAPARG